MHLHCVLKYFILYKRVYCKIHYTHIVQLLLLLFYITAILYICSSSTFLRFRFLSEILSF